ncbi:MAG TPA: 30S ribosomal protein S16 [Candidatus Goldiibacteriota bacterium]|nr:30S ribosomal protein S16 [Candidatus Goldiibacteriota bacterium]HPN65173.1 30S ribosomal protein S16 [Candidatus Goldiibacteriota bacterium]HRQ44647.1 30S ribosomal protein S16 [Candidatus Goldiibacteriota bacterium]
MSVILRLKRMGRANSAFYRIVAIDERRSAKGGEYIEELGFYNPTKNPPLVKLEKEATEKWVKNGAKITPAVKGIFREMGIYKEMLPAKPVKKKKAKKTKEKKAAK